jgi:multidrug transporter EmrE-like cation transporter
MITLPRALRAIAVIFVIAPTLFMAVWASGWRWEPHNEGYEHMIAVLYGVLGIYLWKAADNPAANRSLISFTIWSSLAHAAVMFVHVFEADEPMHLVADIPALILVAAVLGVLTRNQDQRRNAVTA